MKLEIGTEFKIQNKAYKVTGKQKRSIIVEDQKSKKLAVITLARINKYTGMNYVDAVAAPAEVSPLQKMVNLMKIWNPDAKLPTDEASCKPFFDQLDGEASPENLHCDGLISRSAAMKKLANIKKCWKELEKIQGKKQPSYEL